MAIVTWADEKDSENINLQNSNIDIWAKGGRIAYHLRELYLKLVQFKCICIKLAGNDLNNTDFDTLVKYDTNYIGHLLFNNYEVRVVSLFPMKAPENNLVE